ncbi:hypothetical protein [Halomonas kalidii]|uniref:Uncharacterized protein n=1 Tax=Halomonas kalidii TaxID=3043293 RepID=A0ABT6VHS6_9GAMM|nr:hypothetical protein [Halomonas kalidii]MDI5932822.1 hypothetical protein [Halomonas kalidii]
MILVEQRFLVKGSIWSAFAFWSDVFIIGNFILTICTTAHIGIRCLRVVNRAAFLGESLARARLPVSAVKPTSAAASARLSGPKLMSPPFMLFATLGLAVAGLGSWLLNERGAADWHAL